MKTISQPKDSDSRSASAPQRENSDSRRDAETQRETLDVFPLSASAPQRENSGSRRDAETQRETLDVLPLSASAPQRENSSLAVVDSNYEQMGAQLTAQYKLATEGMRAVIRFAGMLVQVREELAASGSARGATLKPGSPTTKGNGLKGWLAQYAPSVPEQNAYRYIAIFDAVRECCKLPAKLKNDAVEFAKFVQAEPEALEEKLKPVQLMLWDQVDGTSGRSWMDRLKGRKARGGDTSKHRKDKAEPMDPQELAHLTITESCQMLYTHWRAHSSTGAEQWAHLSDQDRQDIDTMLMDMRADLKSGKAES